MALDKKRALKFLLKRLEVKTYFKGGLHGLVPGSFCSYTTNGQDTSKCVAHSQSPSSCSRSGQLSVR